MKTNNRYNLPEYLVSAGGEVYPPNPKRMSVTSLINPPLQRTLLMEHWDELTEELSDKFWRFHGTAWDEFVKKRSQWGLCNIKLNLQIGHLALAGRPDYYGVLDKVLADFKDTSVWNLKEVRKDWICQLNVYDYMLTRLFPQLPIDKLQIHGIGRDWRANERLRYNDYLKIPFQVLDIPLWTGTEQEEYVDTQLKDHQHNPRRECSPEECWQKSDTFAVMKKGRKSALRVLDSSNEARTYISEKNLTNDLQTGKIRIEKRPGENTKCLRYCSVAQVCKLGGQIK